MSATGIAIEWREAGFSYASTAGNQAYQQYLGGLNDQLLNLQSNALACRSRSARANALS